MTRDELIAVGAMAIRSHTPDGLCPLCHQDARDVVDAVEPLIRADEREEIAQAIEAAESLAADFTWQGRAFTMGYEGARGLAARIARRGGSK